MPAEAFLQLPLPGEAGFWDTRRFGEEAAFATRGVAWEQPATHDLETFVAAGRKASARLATLDDPDLRAFAALPFDPSDAVGGTVRIPRWSYVAREGGARLVLVGREGEGHAELSRELDHARREIEAWRCRPASEIEEACTPPIARIIDDGRDAYRALVRAALLSLAEGEVEKVVTARRLELAVPRETAVATMLARLPQARLARFLVQRGQETFFGATPETLVRLTGGLALADALAGSRPAPPGELAASTAEELLGSEKDVREHEHVVTYLRDALGRFGTVATPAPRSLLRLPNIWHLHTPVQARVGASTNVLDLVAALHPTPAVLGVPREAARRFLARREGFTRGLYAGSLGCLDAKGEGTFVVGIRSARVVAPKATDAVALVSLYAGGGIVAGSDVDKELVETDAKLAPMLRLFGLPGIAG